MYAWYWTHIYMLPAGSGRRARAYIYASRAQRVNWHKQECDITGINGSMP